ncbi:HEPN/Toprim-associated domain-containing protein [Paraburkholderia sp. LEh10]|uniref:HEPN/Toprim-associated domain-containing protein n=1 Tax=Paraburkholderia sp. LEh10 TaxID=2821353 RepID=UPI001FD80007|nr:HEPN/Toprim-associated domain-containing protein [Paraburkholderia sp. LEh10]
MPSAFITINGYPLQTTRFRYRRWRFKREDRAIRHTSHRKYSYVTSAAVMRKRLAEAGYNRTALELEYLRTLQKISVEGAESYFRTRCCIGRYTSAQRAEAFRRASLNDWLFALKENITNRKARFTNPPELVDEPGRPAEVDVLIDILTYSESTIYPIETEHLLTAFPCASLDCMAVAMLEVVPDSAECILNVTDLVNHELVYCFDDLTTVDETSGDDRYNI